MFDKYNACMTNNTQGLQTKTDSNRSPELIVTSRMKSRYHNLQEKIISFYDNYHVFLCKAFYIHILLLLDQ